MVSLSSEGVVTKLNFSVVMVSPACLFYHDGLWLPLVHGVLMSHYPLFVAMVGACLCGIGE